MHKKLFFAPMVTLWRLTCHSTRQTPCDLTLGVVGRLWGFGWRVRHSSAKWPGFPQHLQPNGFGCTAHICCVASLSHNVCRSSSSSSLLSWSSVSATFASPLIFAELHNGHSGTRCLFEFIKASCRSRVCGDGTEVGNGQHKPFATLDTAHAPISMVCDILEKSGCAPQCRGEASLPHITLFIKVRHWHDLISWPL